MQDLSRDLRSHTLVNRHNSPQPLTAGYGPFRWIPARLRVYGHSVMLCPSRPAQRKSQVGGGIRGCIDGFSYKARRRLMQTVSRINTAQLGCMGFVTLTYHDNWQGRDIKRDLDNYLKRVRRCFPEVAYLWRLEPQKRGAPHYHILLFFPQTKSTLTDSDCQNLSDSWHQIVDNGNLHHAKYGAKVISFEDGYEGVQIYATKYCAKLESEGVKKLDSFAGKYWGRSRNLPLAPIAEVVLSDDQDAEVRRYCRRFLKGRRNPSARRYADTVVMGHTSEVFLKDNEVGFAKNLISLVRKENEAARPMHSAAYPLPFVRRQNPLFEIQPHGSSYTNENANYREYSVSDCRKVGRDFSEFQKLDSVTRMLRGCYEDVTRVTGVT